MTKERILPIRLFLLDVDGVLTDGRIVYDANGVESKFFNVKDGFGIKMLQRAGISVGIISGRRSRVVDNRAAELGITYLYQNALDKIGPYQEILEKTGLGDQQVAYMGDDIVDLPLIQRVGFTAAPADAVSEVRSSVHFVTNNAGGWGAVREVCDLLLKEQGLWEEVTAGYFQS
ncbi:MAG: HAD-IIIA family hydrolase [Geobacteraceae bacterium]|nr:HAD-IIIA family hydrolase [Geobacteraceae bacterium]